MKISKKRLFGCLGILSLILTMVFVILFFILSSSSFLAGALLPLVASSSGIPMTAAEIDWDVPGSRLVIRKLEIGGGGGVPLAKVETLSCSYGLVALLKGRVELDDVDIDGARINWPPGRLDWLFDDDADQSSEPTAKGGRGKKLKLPPWRVNDLKVADWSVDVRIPRRNGGETIVRLDNCGFELPSLVPNEKCRIVNGVGSVSLLTEPEVVINMPTISFGSEFEVDGRTALPKSLVFNFETGIMSGMAGNTIFDGRELDFTCAVTENSGRFRIEKLAVNGHGADKRFSHIQSSGWFDPRSFDGELRVSFNPLSSYFLNLAAGFGGFCLGEHASLNFDGLLRHNDGKLASDGEMFLRRVAPRRLESNICSPVQFNIGTAYAANYDLAVNRFTCDKLDARLEDEKKVLAEISAAKPFIINFTNDGSRSPKNAAPVLNAVLNHLDLRDFAFLIPAEKAVALAGTANANATLRLNEEFSAFELTGVGSVKKLALKCPGYELDDATVDQDFSLIMPLNAETLALKSLSLRVSKAGKPCLSLLANGDINLACPSAEIRVSPEILDLRTLALVPEFPYQAECVRILEGVELSNHQALVFEFNPSGVTLKSGGLEYAIANHQVLAVALRAPFKLGGDAVLDAAASVSCAAEDVNGFLPAACGLRLDNGTLKVSGTCLYDIGGGKMSTSIEFTAVGLGLSSGCRSWRGIDFNIVNSTDLTFGANGVRLAVKPTKVGVRRCFDEFKLLAGTINGEYDSSNNRLQAAAAIDEINAEFIKLAANSDEPKSLSAAGAVSFSLAEGQSAIAADIEYSNLSFTGLKGALDGDINTSMKYDGQSIELEKCLCRMNDGELALIDIASSGRLGTPLLNGDTNIAIHSKHLDLKPLLAMMPETEEDDEENDMGGEGTGAGTPETEAEPPPLSLNGGVLNVSFDLKNIGYGRLIKGGLIGRITGKGGEWTLETSKSTLNGSPLELTAAIDTGKAGGYPFSMAGKLEGQPVAPYLAAFAGDWLARSTGEVNVDLKAEGRGFTAASLVKHLKADMFAELRDTVLPTNIAEIQFLRLIFIPLELLSNIKKLAPAMGENSGELNKVVDFAQDLYENSKQLSFSKGVVAVNCRDGVVNIEKMGLYGNEIESVELNGKINLDGGIDIASVMKIAGLVVPVEVEGTLENPKPRYRKFMVEVIKTNAQRFFSPENIADAFKNAVDGGGKVEPARLLEGLWRSSKDAGTNEVAAAQTPTTGTGKRKPTPDKKDKAGKNKYLDRFRESPDKFLRDLDALMR